MIRYLEPAAAIVLAILWISPLVFAFWAAFHDVSDAVNFRLGAPWTLENFRTAWAGAPWMGYFLNTFLLVTLILAGQFLLCTLAGFAFAQTEFRGRDALFMVVLLQLFILPEVLIVENYRVAASLGLLDSLPGIGAPYMASAFGIFLIVTNSPSTRPLTVGLSLFAAPESGVDISVISAATVMVIAPLLIGFLVFQRQFVQAFLTAGVK